MANKQPGFDGTHGPGGGDFMGQDPQILSRLAGSADAQTLMRLLNQKMGGGLQEAAEQAMKGDVSKLISMMEQVVKTPEGAAAVEHLNQTIKPK